MTSQDNPINDLLQGAAELLDLPPGLRKTAVDLYGDVGAWMREHLEGADDWTIYSQGSMRLGTVVRPEPGGDYDIDSVVVADLTKEQTTREELREAVGAALTGYVEDRRGQPGAPTGLDRGKRCWTLQFDEDIHMDVLPAIPSEKGGAGIHITDRSYSRWLPSNPVGFAEWFHGRVAFELELERKELAKAASVSIEDIPIEVLKTPLHRAVQVLKIHRNRYFEGRTDFCPVSVVITALAGHAYADQGSLADTILAMAEVMPGYVDREGDDFFVYNPAQQPDGDDKGENFAERWTPEHAKQFHEWLTAVRIDITEAAAVSTGFNHAVARLGSAWGPDIMAKSAAEFGKSKALRSKTAALVTTSTGLVTGATATKAAATPIRPHTFHGA